MDNMEIDLLAQEKFDKLPEYSHSIPTETTIGKKWKRRYPYRDDEGPPFYWLTGEYVPSDRPGMVGIRWRRVQVKSLTCRKEKA